MKHDEEKDGWLWELLGSLKQILLLVLNMWNRPKDYSKVDLHFMIHVLKYLL